MSKFNRGHARWETPRVTAGRGPIKTIGLPGDTVTHEDAPAVTRDAKGELFTLAVLNMVGEDTFYEGKTERDQRYRQLIHAVALDDPQWVTGLVGWLRNTAQMRSASVVMAAEMARAWQQHKASAIDAVDAREIADLGRGLSWEERDFGARGPVRMAVDVACQRGDEPSEMIAYWRGRYGRAMPKAMKRGLADAVVRLYTQRNFHRYDSDGAEFRFGDVIELVHPVARSPIQSELFKYAIDKRHNRQVSPPRQLEMLADTIIAMELLRGAQTTGEALKALGQVRNTALSWENVMSLLGGRVDKAKVWESLVPSMGYMALLRNLRNFDRAGMSATGRQMVKTILTDERAVAGSRQFPYRFLSAYQNVDSDHWRESIGTALDLSVANIPAMPGRTLVLVDTSGSMQYPVSERSKMTRVMAAALFGVAFAAKNPGTELYGFANGERPFKHDVHIGSSVLRTVERFVRRIGEDGHGTMIAQSLGKTFGNQDRVVIITDEQTWGRDYHRHGSVGNMVPATVPLYSVNLGGYAATTMVAGPNRYQLAGLTDAMFKIMPMVERGDDASWPWE